MHLYAVELMLKDFPIYILEHSHVYLNLFNNVNFPN